MPASPDPTHHLFSYGTLQQPEVQRTVFGRELTGAPDALTGFRIATVGITDPHVIAVSGAAVHQILVPDAGGDDIAGTRFTLDDAQLAAADRYEVDDYTRVAVTLRSGLTAWVYVAQPPPAPGRPC